jgi:protein TonB
VSAGQSLQYGFLGGLRRYADQHKASVRTFAVATVLVAIVAYFIMHTARQPEVHQAAPVITMVTIQPPKPPPPPPPLPQPKMITQPKMVTPEAKPMQQPTPKNAPPKPASPSVQMGTSIHNNGAPDSFNLSGTPGGDGMLDGGGGGGGSRWGYYAGMVQTQIQEALQKNRVTRNITAGLEVRIWADASGMVTRVALDKSSGDPAVDDAVTNQVLRNLQLNQPPPSDMPMPIVMSLTGEQTMQ